MEYGFPLSILAIIFGLTGYIIEPSDKKENKNA